MLLLSGEKPGSGGGCDQVVKAHVQMLGLAMVAPTKLLGLHKKTEAHGLEGDTFPRLKLNLKN